MINIFIISFFIYIVNLTDIFNDKNIIIGVIISCPKDGKTLQLNLSMIPFDAKIMKCNKHTNLYDAREAGLILDFIINTYNNNKYNIFLFIHDHDISTHYPYSITKRLNKISKSKHIYNIDLIGINCHYYDESYWKRSISYKKLEVVDRYLIDNHITHVNFSAIVENKYTFPCCASFFVNKKLIYLHDVTYYKNLRSALRNFSKYGNEHSKNYSVKERNYIAACYMEFTWTTMFGKTNVPLPFDCKKSTLTNS